MNPLRSVGGRLALALVLVVTGALAIAYLIVVPSYENSLVNARLSGLQSSLQRIARARGETYLTNEWIQDVAEPIANARVVVFHYDPATSLALDVADSNGSTARDVQNDPVALAAAGRRGLVRGTVTRDDQRYAEVAQWVAPQSSILLLSAPLHSQLETVNVVRRRVFIAGGVAIGFAILLGYVLASLFSRRIRRLEQAVERIADGRFDEAVVDPAQDELGQLARAFERMRLRLASLERARAEFIANASHELRTPLFSLAGFLELLASEDLDQETRAEFLAAMREQVTRLTKLATDLLDLSRMDAGRLSVAAEEVDLERLGEELVAELGPRASAGEHALEETPGGPVPARGDGARVLQIGRILVENALVHTPPGTNVRVGASLDGGRATLTVEDDGPGIPADKQTDVFERFFQLEGSVASGSGLGLAIARELAELMDGRIELRSGEGRTRFTLVLPTGTPVEDRVGALLA